MKTFIHIVQNIRGFLTRIKNDHVSAFAAQSAYFILMSIIPILLLMLYMIRFLPITQTDLVDLFFAVVPEEFKGLFMMIVEDVFTKSSALVPLTVVFAAWAASKGILSLYGGLNTIYHVPIVPNYLVARLLSALYTLLFIMAVLVTLVLMVFGTGIQEKLILHVPVVAQFTAIFVHFRFLITLAFLMLTFLIMYVVLPNRRASFKSQLPGAMVSSTAWLIFSWGFSLYVRFSRGYNRMYGNMTTIMFLMLWLYFCMGILLIGAEINAYFEDRFRRMRLKLLLEKDNYKRLKREEREQKMLEKELSKSEKEQKKEVSGQN